MMKQNQLRASLAVALLLCTGLTLWLSVRYYFSVGELQRLQAQYLAINNARAAAQALANDAVEYSKRNSAIDPLLFQFEIKQKPAPAPSSANPASKPRAK